MIKKSAFYISLLGTLSITGCKKFLGTEPDNRTTVTTKDQISQLITYAYPQANYMAFCEAMSDNAEDKGSAGSSLLNTQSYKYDVVETVDYDTPEFYWSACYKAIAQANQALDVIDHAANRNDLKAQRGEALVARAYAHFMLVTFFSKVYDENAAKNPGIPYVTAPEKVVNGQYERRTVQYVYDMIEKDLLEGLPLIDNSSYPGTVKFHFNDQAAHAFAARFYLFKKQYDKVIIHANAAISGNLADNLRPWNTTYSSMQYYDLQATYSKVTEKANLLLQEVQSIWGRSFPGNRFGLGNDIESSFLYAYTNPTGGRFAIGRNVYGSSPQVYNIPKFYEHFVYLSATSNVGNPYNTLPLFTTEEVLFNRVEAYAHLGYNYEAIADLNAWVSKNIEDYDPSLHNLTLQKVRDYYPSLNTGDALIQTALSFKRATFMHEGMRWLDILRLKIPVKHTLKKEGVVINLGPDDNRRVLQLPKTATLSGLEMNPR